MEFADYDVQITMDNDEKLTWQFVGMAENGEKVILKEFDKIPRMSPMKEAPKAYAAPSTGSKLPTFLAGMLVGGGLVFIFMQMRIAKKDQTIQELTDRIRSMDSAMQQQFAAQQKTDPMAGLMRDYNDYSFASEFLQ